MTKSIFETLPPQMIDKVIYLIVPWCYYNILGAAFSWHSQEICSRIPMDTQIHGYLGPLCKMMSTA
jgi:hypothetical protein